MSPESKHIINISRRRFLGGILLSGATAASGLGFAGLYADLEKMDTQLSEAQIEVSRKVLPKFNKDVSKAGKDTSKSGTNYGDVYRGTFQLWQAREAEAQQIKIQESVIKLVHARREKEGPSNLRYWLETFVTAVGLVALIASAVLFESIRKAEDQE